MYLRTIQTRPGNDGEGDLRLGISVPIMLFHKNRSEPGHVAIEEIRGGAGSGGGSDVSNKPETKSGSPQPPTEKLASVEQD